MSKNLVTQVAQKQDDGTLALHSTFGADFSNVVDNRAGKNNYTLDQFFDNYMNFMNNATFVYSGPDQPSNPHIGLWFDTSVSNQDGFTN